ncbi:hypothetical protein CBF34_10135 [Vagococcus penaei]|uniref:Uncharacterized protein n=1 Tax=Vagococcus penaei TaxID=633807 RepID=A0A1Q2D5C8_9ENTE|nr:alpha/beta hydrolase [Vagococcus penaei]AQP53417.1 hypothetical protein BW732_03635 [Vagococcus penaei]RST98642.1 hypothetical protein CBF34_10135 [Vagococcus penaei]
MKKLTKLALIIVSLVILIISGVTILKLTTENKPFFKHSDETYLSANNLSIRYKSFGNQNSSYPTVYLLHGFNAAGMNEWQRLTPYLNPNFHYIAFDWPGMGLSERLPVNTKPTIAYRLAIIDEVIKQTNNEQQPAILLGASYGATMATAYTAKYPQKIDTLIPISPLYENQGGGGFATLAKLPFGLGSGATFLAMGAGPVADFLYDASNFDKKGFKPSQNDINNRKSMAKIKGTSRSFMLYANYQENIDFSTSLAEIQENTYSIFGANDTYKEDYRLKKENIPLTIIDDADHTPHLSQPKKTADVINEWLTSKYVIN